MAIVKNWNSIRHYRRQGMRLASIAGSAPQVKHKSWALVISFPVLLRMWLIAISRFARNTVDVLTIVRELKKVNVPVYFENEQQYSFDKEAELAISLHGAIAQGESENKSENIKWSLDKAAQNPDAQIYNRKCYGYSNAEDGSLVINESEAEVIRQVFQLYLDGYSVGGIKKYVGDVILYKTFSPDFPEKKRIQNNGEHKKYIQEDHHPSII